MPHVLLVDDDADQREIRRLLFERRGHRVSEAATPAAALKLAKQSRPDVVLADLRLPSADDGCALIRALAALAPELPIVVLTGFPNDLKGRPEAELARQILKKPCRSQQILALVERLAPERV